MGFVHNFGETSIELSTGGRHHIYMHNFEQFLIKLIDAGASLAFFCDGQLQTDKNDEWCRRRDDEYRAALVLTEQNFGIEKRCRRFGCKTIAKSLLKLVDDKRYGEVVISTQMDCDVAIAKYAATNDALAVIANDSDFLIFDGNFQWWEAHSMRMNRMRVKRFDRNQLLKSLDLTGEQMKYFATIVGNDYTKHLSSMQRNFHQVAEFCRSLQSKQDTESIYREVLKYMKIGPEHITGAIDLIAKSIKFYEINFTNVPATTATPMDDYCASNVLLYAFLKRQVFQYEMNFVDFKCRNKNNNGQLLVDTLLKVFRKLGGILLKSSQHSNAMLKIVTKYSLHENYMLREHMPIYPYGEYKMQSICTLIASNDFTQN